MSALREAFIHELKDIYDAENQLLKALPKMARAAENDSLRAAFQEHEAQTRKQIWRLGEIFQAFDEKIQGKHCKGMKGLISEAEDIIEDKEGDAALIAAAQKAEHYEIAAYGTLAAWSVALGHEEVIRHLTDTLGEEKDADKRMTGIAQSVVNSHDTMVEKEDSKPKRRAKKPVATKRPSARRTPARAAKAPRSKRLRSTRKARK